MTTLCPKPAFWDATLPYRLYLKTIPCGHKADMKWHMRSLSFLLKGLKRKCLYIIILKYLKIKNLSEFAVMISPTYSINSIHYYYSLTATAEKVKNRDKRDLVEKIEAFNNAVDTVVATAQDSLNLYNVKQVSIDSENNELTNKDAVLLGITGELAGDIVFMLHEGYNFDHGESLSTACGHNDTSVSPIFVAAGPGVKQGHEIKGYVREVDVAPTAAVLLGVNIPKDCEGAPAYQIFTERM